MKKKVGILLDEEVIRHAKHRAAEESRPLSEVIHDALVSYPSHKGLDPKKRKKAYRLFCERPIRLSKDQFKHIVEEIS